MVRKDGKGCHVEEKNSRVRYIGTKSVQKNNKVTQMGHLKSSFFVSLRPFL